MYALKQLSRFLREKQRGTDGGDASSELCNEKRHDKIRIGAERKSHMCGDGRCGGDEESCVYNLSALVHFSIIVIAGTGLTMPIRRPAALLSFMPVLLPIKESGF